MERKDLAIFRPRLASELMLRGYKLRSLPNAKEPERTVWYCEIDNGVISITREFYKSIGKPVPSAVEELFSDYVLTTLVNKLER